MAAGASVFAIFTIFITIMHIYKIMKMALKLERLSNLVTLLARSVLPVMVHPVHRENFPHIYITACTNITEKMNGPLIHFRICNVGKGWNKRYEHSYKNLKMSFFHSFPGFLKFFNFYCCGPCSLHLLYFQRAHPKIGRAH